MKKIPFNSENLPGALGPYSHAVICNGLLYSSGQIPLNKDGVIPNSIEEQTKQVLGNIEQLLIDNNLSLDNVIKTTLFIKDMNDFDKINEIYECFFSSNYPARSCVEVARLPKDVLIEIEVVAVI
ncbi:Rid family detoxifying hydrolase [Lentisphaerota bacterium WC36G]|nr:Rid family detoxifying hydrolase [Lentisphaerae bacterium WC36]